MRTQDICFQVLYATFYSWYIFCIPLVYFYINTFYYFSSLLLTKYEDCISYLVYLSIHNFTKNWLEDAKLVLYWYVLDSLVDMVKTFNVNISFTRKCAQLVYAQGWNTSGISLFSIFSFLFYVYALDAFFWTLMYHQGFV